MRTFIIFICLTAIFDSETQNVLLFKGYSQIAAYIMRTYIIHVSSV